MKKVATPLVVTEQASPATPPSGFVSFYAKTDGFFYGKDDAGVETRLGRVFIDDDTMATATATNVASAESIKAYVDNEIIDLPDLTPGDRTVLDTGTPGFVGVDVVLSGGLAGGDTLTGGTAAGEDLVLASTAHATRGTIDLRDTVMLLSEDKTNTTATQVTVINTPVTRTITLADAGGGLSLGNSISVLDFSATVLYDEPGSAFGGAALFKGTPTLTNRNAETRTITGAFMFASGLILQANGATVTYAGSFVALNDSPSVGVINSGVATMTGSFFTTLSAATINTGATTTLRCAHRVVNATGSGTLTTQIGLDIEALTTGGTNIGIRNASTTLTPPPTATNITAVSATIPHNATTIQLTANASYTLTSAPTITDGQSGETLTIINVDTTDVITIQDQGTLASSNLRLAATTIALGPRDSIVLRYNSTIGDWVQIGQTNVL